MDPIRSICSTRRVRGIADIPGTPGAIGNPGTSGTGNPGTSDTGNPDTLDIPDAIGTSGALGVDPKPADPSLEAADHDWSTWANLGQAC